MPSFTDNNNNNNNNNTLKIEENVHEKFSWMLIPIIIKFKI